VHYEWQRDGYTITTDPRRFDLAAIHRFLTTTYWSPGIPLEVLRRAIDDSVCFGILRGGEQAGFGRVVTDRATFGYLADVFVLESHRGRGLSKWLMECIDAHPDLQGFRRWMLFTRDAHGLYRRFGYVPLDNPDRCMQRWTPDVYKRGEAER
jgi:GNAT superfamily N-acetyltransferase